MNIEWDLEQATISIRMTPSDDVQVFGGEYTLYDTEEDPYDDMVDYGIGFDGEDQSIHISQLTREQYLSLGLHIINHLMTNGQSFIIGDCRDGNGEYLTIKH